MDEVILKMKRITEKKIQELGPRVASFGFWISTSLSLMGLDTDPGIRLTPFQNLGT